MGPLHAVLALALCGTYCPGMEHARFDLVGRAPTIEATPQGGLKMRANFSRVGVFDYVAQDGSVIRELRHPSEVFARDSIESLKGAPLVIGHPSLIDPSNWQALAVGHASDDVATDGIYISGTVRVQDAAACKAVTDGDLVELSLGYLCELDVEQGTYDGKQYDVVQRNIRYNHVGMGPKNWGRAGNEVALKFDGRYSIEEMQIMALYKKRDGEDDITPVVGTRVVSPAAKQAEEEMTPKDETTNEPAAGAKDAVTEPAAQTVPVEEYNKLMAECVAMRAELDKLNGETVKMDSVDLAIDERLRIRDVAKTILGPSYKHDSKPNLQIMLDTIAAADPRKDMSGKGKEYVAAFFDALADQRVALAHARVDGAVTSIGAAGSASSESPLRAAERLAREKSVNAWKSNSKG